MKKETEQQKLLDIYEAVLKRRGSLRCVVGFDAFIDHLLRPIRTRDAGVPVYFDDLGQFAENLLAKGNMSGTIELTHLATKYGGNNPLMSCAIGRAGVQVSSIGAYGDDHIRSAFAPLSAACRLYNFAEPGECYAYEFNQNKIMTFTNMRAQDFTYEQIAERVGPAILQGILDKSNMLALVNYSEQPAVLQVWKGLLRHLQPDAGRSKLFFFDLADCSRLEIPALEQCFEAIAQFRLAGRTCLSLNDNEFVKLCSIFLPDCPPEAIHENMRTHAECLWKQLPVDCLILRTLERFYGFSESGNTVADNIVEAHPNCLTGAGDNQNAGICLGLMCGLPLKDCLFLGVYFGNHYINHGQCGSLEEICMINL